MIMIITRKEFYDLLWSEPQVKLAKEFGVSDSAVGKAARKAGIPRPGPGYWQKVKAGKKVIPAPLPSRFPGTSDWIHFGSKWQQDPVTVDEDEMPVEPTYDESLDELRGRVVKMVGKVPYPAIARAAHSITKKLLDQDDERRREIEELGYTWNKPKFDAPIEKRRLRTLNAIFIKMQSLGCRPYMSTGKYEDYQEASFAVGDQHIRIKLESVEHKLKGRQKAIKKPYLKLTIQGSGRNSRDEMVWQDVDNSKLEVNLQAIVIELVIAGEQQYRDLLQWRYEWSVHEREKHMEEERLRILEEERQAREQQERDERDRIDHLLYQAESIRKAEIIREYVDVILARSNEIDKPRQEIEAWTVWAKKQADQIDPIKNFKMNNI